jgi:hypothetical protein
MVPHKFIPSIISQALVFGYLNNTEICFRNEDVYRVKRRMSVTYPQVFLKKKKKRKNEERETSGDTFQHYIIIHINLIAAPVYLFHKDVTR